MLPERVIKYGGVKFRNLVPPVKINRYVNALPKDKKDSLFEVASELADAKLIDILNEREHSTIDEDTLDDQVTDQDKVHSGTDYKRKMIGEELDNFNKLS